MRYFVTGATGFIGGRVVRQLARAGHDVVALVRDPARAAALARLGVTLHQGDVTAPETLRAPMEGADGVFHIAGWYRLGRRHAAMNERVNVEGTRNVLEAMRDLGVAKGVYTSTLAVNSDTRAELVDESYRHNGPWITVYDRTKWQAHFQVAEPLIEAGLPLVIVEPGAVYGPGDTSALGQTLRAYLRGQLPAAPQGMALCWAHVDDVARGHVLAMERGRIGESYIIAGPPYTLLQALTIAERITGIPAPRWQLWPNVFRALAGPIGLLERLVPLPEQYTAESVRIMAGVTYLGSNEKARRELGYEPRPLEEGLRETLLYEMERLGIARDRLSPD